LEHGAPLIQVRCSLSFGPPFTKTVFSKNFCASLNVGRAPAYLVFLGPFPIPWTRFSPFPTNFSPSQARDYHIAVFFPYRRGPFSLCPLLSEGLGFPYNLPHPEFKNLYHFPPSKRVPVCSAFFSFSPCEPFPFTLFSLPRCLHPPPLWSPSL